MSCVKSLLDANCLNLLRKKQSVRGRLGGWAARSSCGHRAPLVGPACCLLCWERLGAAAKPSLCAPEPGLDHRGGWVGQGTELWVKMIAWNGTVLEFPLTARWVNCKNKKCKEKLIFLLTKGISLNGPCCWFGDFLWRESWHSASFM